MTFTSRSFFRCSWIGLIFLSACNQGNQAPPTVELQPSQSSVDYNGSLVITWSAEKTDYCIASGDWVGNVKRSGSKTLGPLTRDSTYTLDCYWSGELISQTVSIKVGSAKIPEVRISASPLNIAYNGATTLSWSTQHVSDCRASGNWSGNKPVAGSVNIDGLSNDSEFHLECQGPQGPIKNRVQVNVFEEGITVPFVNLTAAPLQIPYNGSTTLSWNSEGADICRASGNWGGSKARSGTEIVPRLTQNSEFVLTCSKAGRRGVAGRDAIAVRIVNLPESAR